MDEPRDPKTYEISFLATDEKGAGEMLQLLKRQGADITLEGPCERITLAYPIKKEVSAFFGYVQFRAATEALRAVDRDIRAHPMILRFLIVSSLFVRQKPREIPRLRPRAPIAPLSIERSRETLPLSNEALEKKIEEILK